MPWAFPFLALKRFVCILDKPCLQANISLSTFADKPCLHNRGRLRVPWTFPPPTFEIADESADKSADKVCLDMCLTNLFKNADARAAKIVQNADKSCLPKLQTKFVYSRQGLSILELALGFLQRTKGEHLHAMREALPINNHRVWGGAGAKRRWLSSLGLSSQLASVHESIHTRCERRRRQDMHLMNEMN